MLPAHLESNPDGVQSDLIVAVEEFTEGRLSGAALEAALVASSSVEYNDDGSKRSEPGYWIVKYLGREFYKMTAAASALLVLSKVIFMTDKEYGSGAELEFNSCFYTGCGYFMRPFHWPLPIPAATEAERTAQADLLRCVFGNPFRPADLDPSWLTPTVKQIAAAVYEKRTFEQLSDLADTLEDAGCCDADVLNHCRQPGVHARGCWPVDVILGKK
jgi:hypothetical protein